MAWDPRVYVPAVVAVSLVVAGVALVVPWWTVEGQAGSASGELHVAPFSPGSTGAIVNEGAVTAVGVLDFVGLLGIAAGLALWVTHREDEPSELMPAAWLWVVAGGFLLVATITAVITWPSGELGFWSSAGTSSTGVTTGASVGWYLTILAGATAAVAGLGWMAGVAGEGTDAEAAEQGNH